MLYVCIRIASRGDSNTHPQHMILWKFTDNSDKNTGLKTVVFK